jgi:hypothetical protein
LADKQVKFVFTGYSQFPPDRFSYIICNASREDLIQELSNSLENMREEAENNIENEAFPDEDNQEEFDICVEGVIFTGESWMSEDFPNPMPIYKIIGRVTADMCDL